MIKDTVMSVHENDLLSSLAMEVAEAKARVPAINLPIQVVSYEGDVVTGLNVLTHETVKVSLLDDKGAATRSNPRTSIQDRADPASNRHVAPGGLMVIERAYKQDDGTYKGFWTQAISHKPERGFINNVYMNLSYHEGNGKDKEPSIMTTFFSKNQENIHRVSNLNELKQALQTVLQPSVPSIIPTALIRLTMNGAGVELNTLSLKRKTIEANGQKTYEYEKPEDAVNRMMNDRIGGVLKNLFARPDVAQGSIEVFKGGISFAPGPQVKKTFNMATGKLIEAAANGNDTAANVMSRMFTGTTKHPKTQEEMPIKLFADGIICFGMTKPNKENPDGYVYQRLACPVEAKPKMMTAANLETNNFKPNSTLIIETKESLENAAPDEEELGISGADADAAREIDQLMNAAPQGMKM